MERFKQIVAKIKKPKVDHTGTIQCPGCEQWDTILVPIDVDDSVCPVCWSDMVCVPQYCIACNTEVDFVNEHDNIRYLCWEQTGMLKSVRHLSC